MPPTIGLAYSFQYIEHYQSEDFDIPLDDIITDKKIKKVTKNC